MTNAHTNRRNDTITRVIIWFDEQDPSNRGWAYAVHTTSERGETDIESEGMNRTARNCGIDKLVAEINDDTGTTFDADDFDSRTEGGWEYRA